jgi:hypothetical protein
MATNRIRQGFLLPDDDDEALAAGDGRIDRVLAEHCVMLFRQRDHHGGIFRSRDL